MEVQEQTAEVQEQPTEVVPCECSSLSEWVQQYVEGECRVCNLATATSRYQEILNSQDLNPLAARIEDALNSEEDPMYRAAEEMDKIKTEVNRDVRQLLCEVDVEVQRTAVIPNNLEEV